MEVDDRGVVGLQVLGGVITENSRERRIAIEEAAVERDDADAREVVLEQPPVARLGAAALGERGVQLPADAPGDATDQQGHRRRGEHRQPRREQHPIGPDDGAESRLDEAGHYHDHDRRRQECAEQAGPGRFPLQVPERPGLGASHRDHGHTHEQQAQPGGKRDGDRGRPVEQRSSIRISQRHDCPGECRRHRDRRGGCAQRRTLDRLQQQREREEQDAGSSDRRHDAERDAAECGRRHSHGGVGIERPVCEPGCEGERREQQRESGRAASDPSPTG